MKSLITRMPRSPSWRRSPPCAPLPFLGIAESSAPSEAMVEIAIVRSTPETELTVSVLALPDPEIYHQPWRVAGELAGSGDGHDGVGDLHVVIVAEVLSEEPDGHRRCCRMPA